MFIMVYNGVTQFNGRVLIAITPTTDFEPVNKIFGDNNKSRFSRYYWRNRKYIHRMWGPYFRY